MAVTLAKAGRAVAVSAGKFSRRLLVEEDAVFARVDREFGKMPTVPGADPEKRSYVEDPSGLMSDAAWREKVVAAHEAAMVRCQSPVLALSVAAGKLAVESIRTELGQCESALAARYRGIAVEAAGLALSAAEDVAAYRLDQYETAVSSATADFEDMLVQQIGQAANRAELVKRLFSPTPAGIRGFGGRGVWWRGASTVRERARTLSIATANTVREQAMREFNVLGSDRG